MFYHLASPITRLNFIYLIGSEQYLMVKYLFLEQCLILNIFSNKYFIQQIKTFTRANDHLTISEAKIIFVSENAKSCPAIKPQ